MKSRRRNDVKVPFTILYLLSSAIGMPTKPINILTKIKKLNSREEKKRTFADYEKLWESNEKVSIYSISKNIERRKARTHIIFSFELMFCKRILFPNKTVFVSKIVKVSANYSFMLKPRLSG